MDGPCGVRGLPTAPRPLASGLTRFACQQPSKKKRRKSPRPGLEEFGWPQVGEFEVAIRVLTYIREGDTLHVYAVDRLGRDALDVQATVRALLDRGVAVEVHGLGRIAKGVGELILAVLAQVADMERQRIRERTEAGREAARQSLAATGFTHRGKASLGRPKAGDAAAVASWRQERGASIAATAGHWGLSTATVKRYCSEAEPAL